MKIEIIDLKKRFQEERYEILKCINRVLKKGNFILTPEVYNFEKSICKFTGSKYCLGVNSGTDAIELILRAIHVNNKDAVITASHTAVATVSAIERAGAWNHPRKVPGTSVPPTDSGVHPTPLRPHPSRAGAAGPRAGSWLPPRPARGAPPVHPPQGCGFAPTRSSA